MQRFPQPDVVDHWYNQLRHGRVSRRVFIKRMTALGVSGSAIAWLLAACQAEQTASPSASSIGSPAASAVASAAASPSGPARGGTMVIGYEAEIPQLEAHTSPGTSSIRFHQLIYSSLLKFSPDLTPVGDLVEDSWDISEDGLTWTFTLRPNLKFSNGEPLTSEDVKYTFDRILNPDVAAIGAGFFGAVDSVAAPAPDTVVFNLKSPSAALPTSLAGYEAVIISKAVAESGDLNRIEAAIGSGPFKVDEWVPDSHMLLSRNEFFHEEGKPYLDGIRVNIIPTQDGLLAAFRQGELDFTLTDNATFARQADGVAEITVARTPALAYNLLFVQTAVEPFTDPKVREALSYALDRQAIIDSVSLGEGELSGPIPPANTRWARPVSDWPDYTPDPARARQLLADAGYADGFEFTMLTQTSNPAHAPRLAEVVQAQWQQVGVRVNIELMEFAAWVQHWLDATIEIVPGNNSGQPDPDFYLYRYFHSTGNLQFISGAFHSQELDELLDEGRQSPDFEVRKNVYDEAQRILVEGRPFLWLYSGLLYTLTSKRVQGFTPLANDALTYIRDIYFTS